MGHALQTVHRRDNKVNIVRGIVVEDIGWLKVLHVTGGFRANHLYVWQGTIMKTGQTSQPNQLQQLCGSATSTRSSSSSSAAAVIRLPLSSSYHVVSILSNTRRTILADALSIRISFVAKHLL